MSDDDITLRVGGREIGGWTQVSITAGAEQLPRTFEIGLTLLNPGDGSRVVAQAGEACEVHIGDDKVVTGYVDRDTDAGDARTHTLGISGRGKGQDLVDCSAEWPTAQIAATNCLDLATKLAKPYGIKVYAAPGTDLGQAVPQFNLNIGESAFSIIDRVARANGLLVFEDADGAVVIAKIGATKAGSAIRWGVNVASWSVTNAMDQRFSDYSCYTMSIDTLGDLGDGSLVVGGAKDPNVPRHRMMALIAESNTGTTGYDLCAMKAKWEAARRSGRGALATASVTSWRDEAGALWAPNTLVDTYLPGLREPDPTLAIGRVTYRYGDDGGRLTDLELLPQRAFLREPLLLLPPINDVAVVP